MARYLLIKDGEVKNVASIEKESFLQLMQDQYDYVINISTVDAIEVEVNDPEQGLMTQMQLPQIGWFYDGQNFSKE